MTLPTNLSLWMEDRAHALGAYGPHILKSVKEYEAEILKLRRALTLASHDQVDFAGACAARIDETEDVCVKRLRKIRYDRVKDRLDITREALK